MSEVKWIKLTTDMFDNRKIKHLRRLPEGNNIVLIWVMLLTLAGRCNAGGMIFLTENIPYTPKMLADELDFEESTVRLALEALERLGMILLDGDCLAIAGWEEHQNIDGLEKIREQTRLRVAKHREKQAQLAECNAISNATVTPCNAIDKEEDKEKEKDKDTDTKVIEKRKAFSPPTVDEVRQYCRERGNGVDAERFVDYYSSNGWMVGKNKMKNWQAAVRTWEKRDGGKMQTSARAPVRGQGDDSERLTRILERIKGE
jgi:predicted phage replisome organizer